MNLSAARPRFDLGLLRRRRELRSELRTADWSIGAGFALALLLVTWLGRASMLVLAGLSGLLKGFGPRHWLWLASELAHDVWVSLALGVLLGGLLWLLPGRVRWLSVGLGYLLLLAGSLIVIVSVPLYAALQTTLQLTQLLLAGGASDLFDAGLATLPLAVPIALALLLLAACYAVPFLARFAQRYLRVTSWLRQGLPLGLLLLGLPLLGRWAPDDAVQTLSMSAVYDFGASTARYYARSQARPVDMRGAPHFKHDLMFGQAPPVEPLESLLHTQKLPLNKPNVVLVVLESASTRQTGLWNGKPQDTPRMTEISQHGLMFDQYYTSAPVSMKSLFSISCAMYPQARPEAETYTNPAIDCLSISELLKQQGYHTGLFHGGHFTYTRKDEFFKHRQYDVMRDGAALKNRSKYQRVMWGADDRAVIDDALDWLEQPDLNNNSPFFLHIIFLAPHEPYDVKDAPTPFGEKEAVDRYRNATSFIDGQVGRLWDYLVSHGKADNTLLVLVGDHGESFGEHRGDFMHGGRIYETAVHTPLILVNPQLFSGKRSQRIGNHTDLVPTILDVMGVSKPPRHQGASLLRGYKPHMLYFYGDWQRHYLGLRDGQWKFIYTVDRDKYELFDLTTDADEQNNLALLHPQQTQAYAERLLEWEQFQRELIPNYEHLVDGLAACVDKAECYLDELKPSFQHGTMRPNKSAGGFPLQLGKKTYEHGIGVTPLSILRYNIRGDRFTRFRGGVGHHPLGKNANLSLKVSTEIYLDDRLIWSSGKLSADEPAKLFDLDIHDGSLLELIGYDVDAETWRDFIDWVDLRLTR